MQYFMEVLGVWRLRRSVQLRISVQLVSLFVLCLCRFYLS